MLSVAFALWSGMVQGFNKARGLNSWNKPLPVLVEHLSNLAKIGKQLVDIAQVRSNSAQFLSAQTQSKSTSRTLGSDLATVWSESLKSAKRNPNRTGAVQVNAWAGSGLVGVWQYIGSS